MVAQKKGKQLHELLCATCHLPPEGAAPIGPNLAGSGSSGSRYFLESVIDPNAVIGQNYQVTEIETKDGESYAGLLTSESDTAVVLRTLTGSLTTSVSSLIRSSIWVAVI